MSTDAGPERTRCPNCSAAARAGHTFCTSCGRRVGEIPAPRSVGSLATTLLALLHASSVLLIVGTSLLALIFSALLGALSGTLDQLLPEPYATGMRWALLIAALQVAIALGLLKRQRWAFVAHLTLLAGAIPLTVVATLSVLAGARPDDLHPVLIMVSAISQLVDRTGETADPARAMLLLAGYIALLFLLSVPASGHIFRRR